MSRHMKTAMMATLHDVGSDIPVELLIHAGLPDDHGVLS